MDNFQLYLSLLLKSLPPTLPSALLPFLEASCATFGFSRKDFQSQSSSFAGLRPGLMITCDDDEEDEDDDDDGNDEEDVYDENDEEEDASSPSPAALPDCDQV